MRVKRVRTGVKRGRTDSKRAPEKTPVPSSRRITRTRPVGEMCPQSAPNVKLREAQRSKGGVRRDLAGDASKDEGLAGNLGDGYWSGFIVGCKDHGVNSKET